MAGASNYPKLPDMDADLLRVTAPDAIIPEHHNNLVDAVQSLEQTVGFVGDGTEGGGSAAFNSSVADFVGFPSVAMPNPRLPWASPGANSWYGRTYATPAGWTLGAGVSVAYNSPFGLAKWTLPATANFLLASCPVTGSTPWHAIWRLRFPDAQGIGSYIAMGFSANGTATDLDGLVLTSPSLMTGAYRNVVNGTAEGTPTFYSYSPWGWVWLKHDGANFTVHFSADGLLWGTTYWTRAAARTPTAFCLRTYNAPTAGQNFWQDLIVFGNSDPLTA